MAKKKKKVASEWPIETGELPDLFVRSLGSCGSALALRVMMTLLILHGVVALFLLGHYVYGHLLLATFVAVLLWGTLRPNSRLFGLVISQVPDGLEEERWITIDDGPDPETTPLILDLLDEYKEKAVFFVIGRKAEQHEDLVREIRDRGHRVGNHSMKHSEKWFWLHGPMRMMAEMVRCQELLIRILGDRPRLFRAPVGHANWFVTPIAQALGLKRVGWSARGYDGVDCDPDEVLNRIKEDLAQPNNERPIILLHEGREHSVEIVRRVLELLKAK